MPETVEPSFKISSVLLEPEKVRYTEKHAKLLDFKSPGLILPNGRPDYSSGTVSLPRRLLGTPDVHGPNRDCMEFENPPA